MIKYLINLMIFFTIIGLGHNNIFYHGHTTPRNMAINTLGGIVAILLMFRGKK